MKHRAVPRYWTTYRALSDEMQAAADRSFALLRENPQHPSLRFKPVGRFYSARVDRQTRALALRDGDDFVWVWIGSHQEYERLIKR